jgi:putative nucleotidyltransferase with HDIG domain
VFAHYNHPSSHCHIFRDAFIFDPFKPLNAPRKILLLSPRPASFTLPPADWMRRVLFVDSDPATREIYGQLQTYWGIAQEVHTAGTAAEATRLLHRFRYDVVVTELVLPDLPGLDLLSDVMQSHPEAARIVISGNSDKLKAAEALNVAHRFFSKPFSFEVVGSLLEHLSNRDYLLNNERIRCMIFKTGALPVLPSTWVELTRMLDSPDTHISDIAAIVEQDPGLTTRLLHTVNSAYFGIARKVVSCSEGIQIVGLELVRGLMMGIKVFDYYKNSPFVRKVFGRIWDHSLRTAAGARKLSTMEILPVDQRNVSFTAGLLHDIGKLVLAANAEAEYREALEIADRESIPVYRAEQQVFGLSHAQIAAYLFTMWGFPDPVVEAVEKHHTLQNIDRFCPALAIHVTQCLQRGLEEEKQLNTLLLDRLYLTPRLPIWRDALLSSFAASQTSTLP